jgi:hypothetical protein
MHTRICVHFGIKWKKITTWKFAFAIGAERMGCRMKQPRLNILAKWIGVMYGIVGFICVLVAEMRYVLIAQGHTVMHTRH